MFFSKYTFHRAAVKTCLRKIMHCSKKTSPSTPYYKDQHCTGRQPFRTGKYGIPLSACVVRTYAPSMDHQMAAAAAVAEVAEAAANTRCCAHRRHRHLNVQNIQVVQANTSENLTYMHTPYDCTFSILHMIF